VAVTVTVPLIDVNGVSRRPAIETVTVVGVVPVSGDTAIHG
jgi:hypothetical protein